MASLHETKGNHHDQSEIAGKLRETKAAFDQATHKITEAAQSLYGQVDHTVREQTTQLRNTMTSYVRKRPLVALGGAMVLGMGLAWLMRRRRND